MTGVFDEFLNATSVSRRAYENYVAKQSIAVPQRDGIAIEYGDRSEMIGPISIGNISPIYVSLAEGDTFELVGNISADTFEYKFPERGELSNIFGAVKMTGTVIGGFACEEDQFDTKGVSGFLNGIEVVED